MKPRRWPNTTHWQLIETTCRALAGSGWRCLAADALGVDRCALRATYDRHDLDGTSIEYLHTRLQAAALAQQEAIESRALTVARARAILEHVENVRHVEQRRIEEHALGDNGRARYRAVIEPYIESLMEA